MTVFICFDFVYPSRSCVAQRSINPFCLYIVIINKLALEKFNLTTAVSPVNYIIGGKEALQTVLLLR